jgi:hypothetical protein
VGNLFLQKGKKPFQPVDFMSFKGDPRTGTTEKKKMSWQDQLKWVVIANNLFGGKDERAKKT